MANDRGGQQQQGRGQQGGRGGGGGGGGRMPTHKIIAKPDDDREARYEAIGVGWQSERGGISIRFNRSLDFASIVRGQWHVMIVTNDDEQQNEGGGDDFGGAPFP